MKTLEKNLLQSNFSHIYIEKAALGNPNTVKILNKFRNAQKIEIDNYREIFCRRNQNFNLQKKSTQLILAVKKDNFVYEGAPVCQNFGNSHFYYTSSVMNCIYNCEYCYLQGMYPSANIVIFVNIDDIFKRVEELLKLYDVYLCISYDTDLLAFEGITGFTAKWVQFAKEHKNLKIEIRTKSSNYNALSKFHPMDNVILAWTLSPEKVAENYEDKTSSLQERLKSVKQCIKDGWNTRLCFDPILYIDDYKTQYSNLINRVFSEIDQSEIQDASIGVFRISKEYFKKIKKQRRNSKIMAYPFVCNNGVYSYSNKHSDELIHFVYNLLNKYVDKEKIYI